MTLRSPGHEACSHASYFLSCDEYEKLLARAKGHCERCGVPATSVPGRGKLVVDHDHRVGQRAVRGLICMRCNSHLRHVDSGLFPPDDDTLAYFALSDFEVPIALPRLGAGGSLYFLLEENAITELDARALDDGVRMRNGQSNQPEMIRIMLAYAQRHMPKGWRP